MKVCKKKRFYQKSLLKKKRWLIDKIYKNGNREAMKPIAVTWTTLYKDIYDNLDIRDGKRILCRFAKTRYQIAQTIKIRRTDALRRTDGGNSSSRFQRKKSLIYNLHTH